MRIGGIDGTIGLPIKSSFTFDGETWMSGIVSDLPEEQAWQCLVKLDEDELLAVGGLNGSFIGSRSTYFYAGRNNMWTKGPSLGVPR